MISEVVKVSKFDIEADMVCSDIFIFMELTTFICIFRTTNTIIVINTKVVIDLEPARTQLHGKPWFGRHRGSPGR